MKNSLNLDERSRQVAGRVISIMYFITILALIGVIIYRQLALGQEIQDFKDFATIMLVNSLFLLSALLYFGVFSIRKIRIRHILLFYLAIVVLGALFTLAKYRLFTTPALEINLVMNKILIVAAVSGVIVIFFLLFAILGRIRSDRELVD